MTSSMVIDYFERPRTSHRVPPGGRSNIVFNDEFTSVNNFHATGKGAQTALKAPKIDVEQPHSPRRPSRKMFDGTRSMEAVLSHSVNPPTAISSRRSGATSSKTSFDTIFSCSSSISPSPIEKIHKKTNFIDRSSMSSLFAGDAKPTTVRTRGFPGGATTFSF